MGARVTVAAILKRAEALLASPLPHEWASCEFDLGPYCPRCAVARATTELTRQMAYDAGDRPLKRAVMCIALAERGSEKIDQDRARAVIQAALRLSRKRRS